MSTCLFIKRQVLILAEEGDQQELINSDLVVSPGLFSCQRAGCSRRPGSLRNHKPVKPAFLLQPYILQKDRLPQPGGRRDTWWWGRGGGRRWPSEEAWHRRCLSGQLSGIALLAKQPFLFHSPRSWRAVIPGLITPVCKTQECENVLEEVSKPGDSVVLISTRVPSFAFHEAVACALCGHQAGSALFCCGGPGVTGPLPCLSRKL